jgi:cell division protein ZapA (FtsZ GTPase activity inhibitor)
MAKGGLRIDLLGASFSIAADEDPAYLQALLTRYRRVIDEARAATGLTDPVKLAIIAGIVLCDEAEKAKRGTSPDDAEAERIARDLIARIDEALGS